MFSIGTSSISIGILQEIWLGVEKELEFEEMH